VSEFSVAELWKIERSQSSKAPQGADREKARVWLVSRGWTPVATFPDKGRGRDPDPVQWVSPFAEIDSLNGWSWRFAMREQARRDLHELGVKHSFCFFLHDGDYDRRPGKVNPVVGKR
jgi:hypothetical protein